MRLPALMAVAVGGAFGAAPARAQLAPSTLAIETGSGWHTFWQGDRPAERYAGPDAAVTARLAWRAVGDGIERADVRIAGTGRAWRLRLIVVRMDPARLDIRLRVVTREAGTLAAWSVDSLPADARLGFNAGQFDGARPWGWLVRAGTEVQPPGTGTLAAAVTIDATGSIRIVPASDIGRIRAEGGVIEAFQSYPTLLEGEGAVPSALRGPGRGIDVEHRDSRLAIGTLDDGRLVLVLTRFEALGGALAELPFGPTIPEMAAIMGVLGCRAAVSLDGGISGQLALRDNDGGLDVMKGMRRVPLALEAWPRTRLVDLSGRN